MFPKVSAEKVQELARKVGRRVAAEYPGVDAEDIASEAVTRLMAKAHRIEDPTAGYVYRVLERDARAYAASVRYDYIVSTSQYVYTPREIKALLAEVYYNPGCWDVPSAHDDLLSGEIDIRTVGVSLMDIRAAMEQISPEHREALDRRFGAGEDVHRQRVTRAVEALTRVINRHAARVSSGRNHEGPGSRKAMSNSEAQYVTRAEMNGDRRREKDPIKELERIRSRDCAPAGTYFDWNKKGSE